jgi:hypothetical protein
LSSPQASDAISIVQAAGRAYAAADWDGYRGFIHPDAEFDILAGGGQTVSGRDRIIEALRASEDDVRADLQTFEQVRPGIVLVRGFARAPGQQQGPAFAWLVEVREGMMWRVRLYSSDRAALSALHGWA